MEASFQHTRRWLIDTYCGYVGCTPVTSKTYTLCSAQEQLRDGVANSYISNTIHRIELLVGHSPVDVCMVAYLGFNDDLFRDLLHTTDRQRILLRRAVGIFIQNIRQTRVGYYHLFEYMATIVSCMYWIYVKNHLPTTLHLCIIRLMVCTYIARMSLCDLYHGCRENAYVGFNLALLVWTDVFHESCILTRHNRYRMKRWVDLYTLWYSASSARSGRGSPDVTRSVFFACSSFLLTSEEIQYHEFARTFELLFRYMLMFDQPEFMAASNTISSEVLSTWGTMNRATFETLYRHSTSPHAMVYRTDC